MKEKIAVLMMAYGGPDSLDDIEPYLADIRGGRPTSQELIDEITERYRLIGGRSPILGITRAQAAAVEDVLNATERGDRSWTTYVGMRHWHPYIGEVIPEILKDGNDWLVAVVMAPHYSRMSVGAYMGKVEKALHDLHSDIPVCQVESWKAEPAFIDAVSRRIEEALKSRFNPEERDSTPVLFTAHSLPARVAESGDPYREEILASVELVAAKLDLNDYRFAFQSQGATADPWLGPTVEDTLEDLAAEGKTALLLVPIGFVCDHVEVLYDVDIEHREQAAELGIRLERTEMLNDDPGLAAAVAGAVRKALDESE